MRLKHGFSAARHRQLLDDLDTGACNDRLAFQPAMLNQTLMFEILSQSVPFNDRARWVESHCVIKRMVFLITQEFE